MGTKIEDLIQTLQRIAEEYPGVEIFIVESSQDWELVLCYIPYPDSPDESVEIRI